MMIIKKNSLSPNTIKHWIEDFMSKTDNEKNDYLNSGKDNSCEFQEADIM